MSQAGTTGGGGTIGPTVPTQFTTDAGVAIPAANNINIVGSGGASTSGAGSTVTVIAAPSITPWTDEATSFAAVVNNGYFVTAAATATLPAAPTQGQFIQIETATAGNVVVQTSGTQVIRMGSGSSSAGGTATSSAEGNSVNLVYRLSNDSWYSISTEGTWTLA